MSSSWLFTSYSSLKQSAVVIVGVGSLTSLGRGDIRRFLFGLAAIGFDAQLALLLSLLTAAAAAAVLSSRLVVSLLVS